jgi:Mce-associated membrane protein
MADDDADPESRERESAAAGVSEVEVEVSDDPDALEAVDPPPGRSHVRLTLIATLAVVVALGGLTGWLGFRAKQSLDVERQRQTFLQVGRDGATNLTTLDYQHIDTDVQRILGSATGTFYDDFAKRAPSFTDVVKQIKSTSVGTVIEAGLEPGDSPTAAHVLVSILVKSQFAGQPAQEPRSLRMRLEVQKVDDQTKVSDVEYVP